MNSSPNSDEYAIIHTMAHGGKIKPKISRWLDECKMALSGIVLATRERNFLLGFFISFVIFGTLMSLLSSSAAPLGIFWHVDLGQKLNIIWQGFLGIFTIDGNFWIWLLNFMIIILQSILIGLVVLVWQKRRRSKKSQVVATASNLNNIEHAGVAAGLAVLGSGCPTCGTTLLTPMLGTLFSTSGYAFAGTLSSILTIFAVIVALFSLKRLGNSVYTLIASERFQKRRATSSSSAASSPTKLNLEQEK